MGHRFLALVTGLIIQTVSCAASNLQMVHLGDSIDYAIPSGSPVKFLSPGEYPGQAKFKGRFLLTGTYHYGYLTNDSKVDATDNLLDLYFLPDKKISKLLPYWQRQGAVKEIRFKNDGAFVHAVIPSSAVEQLREKKRFSVRGRVSIWAEDYQASIDCDYATYSVRFVSIYQPASAILSQSLIDQYGC